MNILIVDDSKASRMIIERSLRQAGFGGHAVQGVGTADEAYEVIVSRRPGLVLCDWNMPGTSGIELLERLRAEGVDVTLGFVTSEGTEDVRARARAAGAAFFVSKPVTPDKLGQALGPILE